MKNNEKNISVTKMIDELKDISKQDHREFIIKANSNIGQDFSNKIKGGQI